MHDLDQLTRPQAWAGILTDIDDTLTLDGDIEPAALDALHELRSAGIPVIAVTGRPAGWSEAPALHWPLATIVAENGSVRLSAEQGRLVKHYIEDDTTRQHQHRVLMQVLDLVERTVPGARRASDSAGRETDIAIDHSEHTHLPPERVAEVVALMRSQGLVATVSSIHINGWLGTHNKWTGACWAVKAVLGQDLPSQRARWVYVGDSTNDQVMFEHMPHSVGVANIRRFWDQLRHRPRYVTRGERGQGFAEAARHLLRQPATQPTM